MLSLRSRRTPAPAIPWFSGTASSTSISPSAPAERTNSAPSLRRKLQHTPTVVDEIDLASDVLSKRTDPTIAGKQLRGGPRPRRRLDQLPDCAAAVIAENVCTRQTGNRAALIHIAADDSVAFGVIVFCNRQNQPCHVASGSRAVAVHAFHHVPAKISATLQDVDLLILILTDIATKEPTRTAFEG